MKLIAGFTRLVVLAGLALVTLQCDDEAPSGDDGDPCTEPDQDGVIGGDYAFQVDVSDTAFSPVILKAQNSGNVSLTVRNTGTKPHSFTMQCLTTNGCTACFPDGAKVGPIEPGATATTTFVGPEQEGIFTIASDVPGDTFTAQFILQ